MATSESVLQIGGENKKEQIDPKAMPDWKRWNNYGIALFDQKQFAEAADAFDEVMDFKNEYRAFAYTNKALALMELSGWKDAEKLIEKALKLDARKYACDFPARQNQACRKRSGRGGSRL